MAGAVTTVRKHEIDTDVKSALDGAECVGKTLRIHQQLDRDLFQRVNKVLESLGGKWDRKAKAHLFDGDCADMVEEVLLTGVYTRTKQDFGAFFTPQELAARMVERAAAGANGGHRWLEPSAGDGAILRELLKRDFLTVTVVEIQPMNVQKLHKILPDRPKGEWLLNDFLALSPNAPYPGRFDRIVMNPPFAKRADVHHIRHAWDFLKPGGRLVAIASAAVMYRSDALGDAFRKLVNQYGSMVELPVGTFKDSGTMVRTVFIVMDKPE